MSENTKPVTDDSFNTDVLQAKGKTVRMVTYPGSPHFPILWEQRLNVMQELTNWLAKYNP